MSPSMSRLKFTVAYLLVTAVGKNVIPYDTAAGTSAESVVRIANGVNAVPHEFPFMVALHAKKAETGNWSHVCGGSLVTNRHVITAAHCYKSTYLYSVILGAHSNTEAGNTTRIAVWKWEVHPGFTGDITLIAHDIAVITLKVDATLSPEVGLIPLPKKDTDESGKSCTAIGWGRTWQDGPKSKVLQKTQLNIIPPSACKTHFKGKVHPGVTCAYGFPSGICSGDSGGPLVCIDLDLGSNASASSSSLYLFWVASAGEPPCGGLNVYALFTRVGYRDQLEFVRHIIGQELNSGCRYRIWEVCKIAAGICVLQSIFILF